VTKSIWQGARVRLRAIEPGDWEAFHENDADTEAARLNDFIALPRSAEAAKRWAQEQAVAVPEGDNFRFAIENLEGELVGSISVHDCNRRNGTFSYGIGIFRAHWRKGYAADAIRILLTYYFGELGYQKVTVGIYAFNQASVELHQRLGFQHEGRRRRMVRTAGQYHDEVLMGLTVEEFRALK
jgi:RimJ/RimL family protein N-acetyltransferase